METVEHIIYTIVIGATFILSLFTYLKTKTMATKEDLATALQVITDNTTKLGTDIQALAAKIGTGGLSQAELDDTVSKLTTAGQALIDLDAATIAETPAA